MATTLSDAADAFFEAANRLLAGDATAFDPIWSKADDISHLSPTGESRTGRQAVIDGFARESQMGFQGTLVGDERRFVETPDMGFLVCTQRTSGMTRDGQAIASDIRATTIFRKEDGHWRVVHHHADRF
jgi:ketosteroid isomerase-like protein